MVALCVQVYCMTPYLSPGGPRPQLCGPASGALSGLHQLDSGQGPQVQVQAPHLTDGAGLSTLQ